MESKLREIRERVLGELAKAESSAALEQIRVGVLGKKGELTALLRGMGKLPPEERPKAGQRVNEVRAELEGALEAKGEEIKAREKAARLEAEAVDVTLPGPARGAAEGSGRAAFAKGALCAAGRAAQSRAHSLHSLAHVLFYLAAQPFIIVFRFLLRHTSASLFFLVA